MTETIFKLKEKTVILFGAITPLVQSAGAFLVELGADVAFVDSEAEKSQRFINNLMEMRQARSNYGRSATVGIEVTDDKSAKDAISRTAELFGSVDVLVAAQNLSRRDTNPSISQFMTDQVLEFFNTRGRGRIIYLTHSPNFADKNLTKEISEINSKLAKIMASKCAGISNKNITINLIQLGLTEEFLQQLYPKMTIQAAFKELQKKRPELKLTDSIDIANLVAFLASPLSVAINNQVLYASYGNEKL